MSTTKDTRSLFHAVNQNDAAAVQQALRNGADVNCKSAELYNRTPLFAACYSGSEEIVRILLDAGADVRCQAIKGCSPIERACASGRLSIVEMLINHDKDLLEMEENSGCSPLCDAIFYNRLYIFRFLLDRGANVHATGRDGMTALMRACGAGNLAIVRTLLDADVDVETRDQQQRTALHCAATSHISCALIRELILQHNANMFVVDQDERTPFDLISHRPDLPVVNMFLGICSNKMTQDHGRLALHAILRAAEYAFVEIREFHPPLKPIQLQIRLPLGTLTLNHFRTLLSTLDTNLIRNRDENGKLPVHLACRTNAPLEVLSMLVEMDPATLHMAEYHAGALPLHECCCGVVNNARVRFLIEQGGVGTLAARTREGALPLHVLCESTNPSLQTVQYMIRSFPGSVTARTNAGLYPFVMAACESSSASLSVVYELVRANPDLVIRIFN